MRRAAIFSNSFSTAGGGERSALDYGLALSAAGYQVTFVSNEEIEPLFPDLLSHFGIIAPSDWKLKHVPTEEELLAWVEQGEIDCFVNHSFATYLPNKAKFGICAVMFPQNICDRGRIRLRSYDRIVCISSFTEDYVKLRWGADFVTDVLVPPISPHHLERKQGAWEKEKLILNVGRFNVEGHNKNQLEVIRCFKRLLRAGVLDNTWKLILVGKLNSGRENIDYLELCQKEADSSQIEIETNVDHSELCELYERAACLWQFTGLGSEYGVAPENCEHLGLVSLDCFAYGVIPVVFERSGIARLIRFGEDGYHFKNFEMLSRIMGEMNSEIGTSRHGQHVERLCARAGEFSFANFSRNLVELLERQRDVAA